MTQLEAGEKMISLDYKDKRALHEQIEEKLKELIISGIMAPDEQIPSVRELSVSLTVNPNTVQKAYKKLEADGYIYSVKAKGNFVAPITEKSNAKQVRSLYNELDSLIKNLIYLGEDKKTILSFVQDFKKEEQQ